MTPTSSRNVYLTIDGEIHTVQEWADMAGISRQVIEQRLLQGWDADEAVWKPRRKYNAPSKETRRQNWLRRELDRWQRVKNKRLEKRILKNNREYEIRNQQRASTAHSDQTAVDA